jgi:hypothetical protein
VAVPAALVVTVMLIVAELEVVFVACGDAVDEPVIVLDKDAVPDTEAETHAVDETLKEGDNEGDSVLDVVPEAVRESSGLTEGFADDVPKVEGVAVCVLFAIETVAVTDGVSDTDTVLVPVMEDEPALDTVPAGVAVIAAVRVMETVMVPVPETVCVAAGV